MEKAIVWFKNDLRLHDQKALTEALGQSKEILPVYCIDPRQFENTHLGFPKQGAFFGRFLLESLNDLKSSMQAKGSNLLVLEGKPEELIPALCEQYDIEAVFGSKEVGTEEIAIENALENALWKHKIPLKLYWQSTLYHIEDIPWPIRNLPDIFTKFRKECERNAEIKETLPTPQQIPTVAVHDWPEIPTLQQLNLEEPIDDERSVITLAGGESQGMVRLNQYFWERNLLKQYKATRNGLLGVDYSSKFSPWLALGCLSPRFIYEEVKRYEQEVTKNQSTYWLVFELIWRDYFRFVVKKFGADVFRYGGIKKSPLELSEDLQAFELWRTGQTGVPFIDANMRELLYTGFMSNRGRQNVASFLVKDLQIDWRWGAMWFESQLLDYDVASNWGNWNYVAGIGNDPRENRYFNIISQAMRYDAKGDYVRQWVPELKAIPGYKIHHPSELPNYELNEYGIQLGHHYPKPLVDFNKWMA